MLNRTVPTPVVVLVAVLALVLGSLGTATAAGLTKPQVRKIAAKVVKKQAPRLSVRRAVTASGVPDNAINGADVADGSLTSADLAPGSVPAVRWALVNADHTAILAQSGGITIAGTISAGVYLDMGSDVAGKALSATNAYLDGDAGYRGALIATVCGGLPYGGECLGGGPNTSDHVWVFTQNSANNLGEKHAFYVSVVG